MRFSLILLGFAAFSALFTTSRAYARAEEKSVVTGTLEIVITDNFKTRRSKSEYFIRDSARNRRIRVRPSQDASRRFQGGETVSAEGTLSDSTMEDAQITLMQGGPPQKAPSATTPSNILSVLGAQKAVFLLVNYQSAPGDQPYTPQQFKDTTLVTLNNFFLENSYQQTWLAADVFGWITVPSTCFPSALDGCVDTVAQSTYGIDLSPYSKVIYLDSKVGSGIAILGGKYAYAGGGLDSRTPKTIAHEIGHLFGLYHAGASVCGFGDAAFCAHQEVDDHFDTMSYGNNLGHYNAFAKKRLSWLGAGSSPPISVVTQSSTLSLAPLETRGPEARALKVLKDIDPVTGTKVWYYVENRQALGFDSFLPAVPGLLTSPGLTTGVAIHLEVENTATSRLLHLNPIAPLDFESLPNPLPLKGLMSALQAGQRFVDPDAKLIIENLSTDPSGAANVRVTLGTLARVSLTAPAQKRTVVSPGSTLALAASVTPGDSAVAAVDFKINGASVCHVTSAPYSCSWSVPAGADRLYELQVVAQDSRGLSSDPASAILGTDSVAPLLSLSGLSNGQIVSPGATVSVTPAASDNLEVHYYETYLNGILVERFPKAQGATNCKWTIPSYLPDASYALTVKAFDRSGNSATATIDVKAGAGGPVTLIPPSVNINPMADVYDGASVNPYTEHFLFTGTSTPQSVTRISLPFFKINGIASSSAIANSLGTFGLQTLILNPPGHQTAIAVVGRDASGIQGTGAGVALTVAGGSGGGGGDLTPPAVSITNPANGAKLSARSKVTLAATASDNVGVTAVDFHVNGKRLCSDLAAPYACAWTVPRGSGVTYLIEARAYDAAGNVGTAGISVSVP